MPFVQGDRLRTEAGRVEIQFPDGTAIEVGEYSLVEAVTPTRVRLLAGTMDHIQRRAAEAGTAMSAAYLPQDLQTYGSTFDRYGSWQYDAPYGYVWYPTRRAGLAAVPLRLLVGRAVVRLDVDRHRRVVVADASLRPLGLSGATPGSGFPGRTWGPAWVSWACGAGLRELVPARFRRPSGLRRFDHRFGPMRHTGTTVGTAGP